LPPGDDTTATRTPRPEPDPDDEREREGLFDEAGLSEPFTNPVATTESVLSSDANPRGSDELSASDSGLTDSFEDVFGGGER